MGIIQIAAKDITGSTSEKDLIPPTQITESIGEGRISDFSAECGKPSDDSFVDLNLIPEDPATPGSPLLASRKVIDTIELPSPGTVQKSYETPIKVKKLAFFGTRYKQGTAGRISSKVLGQSKSSDISPI